ncbi:hypothetical protein JMA_39210 (plasmid) [Jeotgalibacillus malaysiensis]|uniref:Uncharacterized protein n=1 Tax=Jeotgalibacillus malaysiensis TaxID=1508404 RepID=A0A0B5AZ48_9BACL|nr:hypothetical protein [Jeotgalibacillus malaysiensis]AJD93239.1 hypothetical protein JMA_39210 [Jeotgalibacillus malaysiensis]
MKKVYYKEDEKGNVLVDCFPSTKKSYYEELQEYVGQGYEQVILTEDIASSLVNTILQAGGKLEDITLYEPQCHEFDPAYVPTSIPWYKKLVGNGQRELEQEADEHHRDYRAKCLDEIALTRKIQEQVRNEVEVVNRYPRLLHPLVLLKIRDFKQYYSRVVVSLNGKTLEMRPNGVFVTESEELEEMVKEAVEQEMVLLEMIPVRKSQ